MELKKKLLETADTFSDIFRVAALLGDEVEKLENLNVKNMIKIRDKITNLSDRIYETNTRLFDIIAELN